VNKGSALLEANRELTPDLIPKHQPPVIGIVTALVEEYAAVKALLENGRAISRRLGRRSQEYWIGQIPSSRGGIHQVVLTLAAMGTNIAATRAERLLLDFPSVNQIVMTGIAGGCPNEDQPAEHVLLGDIVVSSQAGVIQYDFNKETPEVLQLRNPPRPPSSTLLDAVRLLTAGEHEGSTPWIAAIERGLRTLKWKRPPLRTDPMRRTNASRSVQRPRVFVAPIACANKLLKNPKLRDTLRDNFGVKAIEMESSGIADASWDNEIGYLAVRGICDYCDPDKSDVWHNYAAMAAAAYTHTLIASLPALGESEVNLPRKTDAKALNLADPSFIPSWFDELGSLIRLEMVSLSGALFLMGSPEERFLPEDLPFSRVSRISDRKVKFEIAHVDKRAETPSHTVRLSNFAIGKYPITQGQWQFLMGSNPSEHKGESRPVDSVSWENAEEFCEKLRSFTGKNYRLPTESQWEYACRAGIYDDYGFVGHEQNLHEYAWFDGTSEGTQSVGLKKPNAYGLYDMHGNVWEWCSDLYAEKYYKISLFEDPPGPRVGQFKVLRGGAFSSNADECRAAFRFYQGQKVSSSTYGFRVAIPTTEPSAKNGVCILIGKGDSTPISMNVGGEKPIEMRWYEPSIAMTLDLAKEQTHGATYLSMSPQKQILHRSLPDRKYVVSLAAMILTQFIRNKLFGEVEKPVSTEDAFAIVHEYMRLNDLRYDPSESERLLLCKQLKSKQLSMTNLINRIDKHTKAVE
jgi:formylglycine-generating enzyme required for sulfatase activity/nucleoside phosphorylase